MNRRKFIALSALAPAAAGAAATGKRLGASTSTCGIRHRAGKFEGPLAELEYYRKLGAAGGQIGVADWTKVGVAKQIRAKAEEWGMYLEGQIGLPKDEADVGRFDAQVADYETEML